MVLESLITGTNLTTLTSKGTELVEFGGNLAFSQLSIGQSVLIASGAIVASVAFIYVCYRVIRHYWFQTV